MRLFDSQIGILKVIRTLLLIALTAAIFNLMIAAASASGGGEELRRIDTSNVNKPTDINTIGETGGEAGHGTDSTEEGSHEEESEEAEDGHGGEEKAGENEGEEVHHAAWMIPGWQSIFSVLAVVYFGLMVTFLPRLMAKEEH